MTGEFLYNHVADMCEEYSVSNFEITNFLGRIILNQVLVVMEDTIPRDQVTSAHAKVYLHAYLSLLGTEVVKVAQQLLSQKDA